ncbi:helix-turn-helix domain-containing protein [Saccharomonospora halophila]|uniref:helix-turn-helix domain-containing protein n=1 Tax=Saccharomonospora halophila TaxID=129922 RepID=UPI0003A06940|nr:AraC family transcriptional regulator [Saccharomonospora halophila]
MGDMVEESVLRVIEFMRQKVGDEVTIDDMARTAMFSKFHFSRMFQRVTGVSPGRFLSAVRLQEAKRLLLSTSLTVTEVSHRVGYASVGTFSSRFRDSVGVSPSMYRHIGEAPTGTCFTRSQPAAPLTASVYGDIAAPADDKAGLIFVGLFRDRLPQGRPVRCTIMREPGPYVLDNVPQGQWYLLTHSVAADRNEILRGPLDDDPGLFVGSAGPVEVSGENPVRVDGIRLRPMTHFDPPVLLGLLELRERAFQEKLI